MVKKRKTSKLQRSSNINKIINILASFQIILIEVLSENWLFVTKVHKIASFKYKMFLYKYG